MGSPLPFTPRIPPPGPQRGLYRSVASVLRLSQKFLPSGSMSLSWNEILDMADPYWGIPGQIQCRLDLQFTRPGKDVQMPLVAGRAPDRVGLLFFDPFPDDSGRLLVKSGDRIVMLSGPVTGTFQLNQIPESALDYIGAHHIETQVVEVSQALEAGALMPFPGSDTGSGTGSGLPPSRPQDQGGSSIQDQGAGPVLDG